MQKGEQGDFLEEEGHSAVLEGALRRQLSKERSEGSTCARAWQHFLETLRSLSMSLGMGGGGSRGLTAGQRPDRGGSCVP